MRAALVLLLVGSAALSAAFPDHPFPPFKIADHLYYVGSKELASYLVTTPQGHILINSSLEHSVPMIKASVEKLGFKFSDIRILLISHAHFDHCESLATMKALTGAQVFVMQGDDDVVASGGKGAIGGDGHWKPVTVDRVLHDGEQVRLGGATLVAHLTAGHTPGCTTWTLVAEDGQYRRNVVIVGSVSVLSNYRLVHNPTYPDMARDFEHSFQVLKALPCGIFLGAHGIFFNMEQKYATLQRATSNPFVDPAGYRAFIEQAQSAYETKLHKEESRRH